MLFLKLSLFQCILFLICFYFFPFFLLLHNTVMIYNTRNWSNDTTESQKEKNTCFNAHFQYNQLKITGLNKMWSLKGLAILKCDSRMNLLFHFFISLLYLNQVQSQNQEFTHPSAQLPSPDNDQQNLNFESIICHMSVEFNIIKNKTMTISERRYCF